MNSNGLRAKMSQGQKEEPNFRFENCNFIHYSLSNSGHSHLKKLVSNIPSLLHVNRRQSTGWGYAAWPGGGGGARCIPTGFLFHEWVSKEMKLGWLSPHEVAVHTFALSSIQNIHFLMRGLLWLIWHSTKGQLCKYALQDRTHGMLPLSH